MNAYYLPSTAKFTGCIPSLLNSHNFSLKKVLVLNTLKERGLNSMKGSNMSVVTKM